MEKHRRKFYGWLPTVIAIIIVLFVHYIYFGMPLYNTPSLKSISSVEILAYDENGEVSDKVTLTDEEDIYVAIRILKVSGVLYPLNKDFEPEIKVTFIGDDKTMTLMATNEYITWRGITYKLHKGVTAALYKNIFIYR